jgi:hypothetical protein
LTHFIDEEIEENVTCFCTDDVKVHIQIPEPSCLQVQVAVKDAGSPYASSHSPPVLTALENLRPLLQNCGT